MEQYYKVLFWTMLILIPVRIFTAFYVGATTQFGEQCGRDAGNKIGTLLIAGLVWLIVRFAS